MRGKAWRTLLNRDQGRVSERTHRRRFSAIDAVSFVSPKHVKQMADSEEVMARLLSSVPDGVTLPEIIGIVVNEKGLERALATPGVSTIGYPYSISAYFRRANANMTRAESRQLWRR